VVIADSCFTAPAVLVQLITGFWMIQILSLPLSTPWIAASLALFAIIGACWLPVLWLQIQASRMARRAVEQQQSLPPRYFRVMRWWFWLGWPAFLSVIGIFWLMVMKPA
jgi:uncharacterized membrane protein